MPSSSTVTPLAATRWPMRPENALEPLRLKSPSRPWPIASCSSTPGQPGPSTTLISPAFAGRDSRLVSAALTACVDIACDDVVAGNSRGRTGRRRRRCPTSRRTSPSMVCSAITRDRQAHQRPHVGGQRAVGARDQHDVVFAGEPGHHLHDARILRARQLLDLLEQRDLLRAVERRDRVHRRIQHAAAGDRRRAAHLDAAALAGGGDRAHRLGGVDQGRFGDVVGVRERGLLARDRAHADALVDAEAAALDDAFLEAPAFAARVLEVQIGVVDAVRRDAPPAPSASDASVRPNGSSSSERAMARRSIVGSREIMGRPVNRLRRL